MVISYGPTRTQINLKIHVGAILQKLIFVIFQTVFFWLSSETAITKIKICVIITFKARNKRT